MVSLWGTDSCSAYKMSKHTHNEDTLQRYLLGSLHDTEAGRMDEWSVAGREWAEALKIAASDLIDAYVQDELTGTSLEQFRAHYLASPLRREKVRFAQAFQVFALKDAAQVAGAQAGLPAKPGRVRKQAGWFAAVGAFFGPRP